MEAAVTFRYETRAHVVWMDEEGIVRTLTKPQAEVTLEDAELFVRRASDWYQGRRHPVLIDLQGIRSISREARAYYAGPETARVSSACALLVKSPMARVVGNFFMGLNQSIVPTRLFTSEAAAVEWLRQYL
jgi:hypothetical protein